MPTPSERRELTSWKEIANHLRVNTRTAQKWERDRGMPVRRLPGGRGRGRVAAYVDELQQWKDQEPAEPPPATRRWWPWAPIALAIGVAVLLAVWLVRPGPEPAEARVDGESLVVKDTEGHELWRKKFPRLVKSVYEDPESHLVWVGDLDGDGKGEVLFSAFTSAPWDSVLICYSNLGKERWRFVPGHTVRTATETFQPPFITATFEILSTPSSGPRSIVVASHHQQDYPSQIALVSSTGRLIREYWHSGQLNHLSLGDLDQDGRPEIYGGGVNNGYAQATLVELDPETMDGASLESSPTQQLLDFRPGVERRRVLFPRSCLNRVGEPYNSLANIRILPHALTAGIQESFGIETQHLIALYTFGPSLTLTGAEFTDTIGPRHAEARRTGKIHHDYSPAEAAALHSITELR